MVRKVRIPANAQGILGFHYSCHYSHLARYAQLAGCEVEVVERDTHVWCTLGGAPNFFSIDVDGKQLIIDFSDLFREGLENFSIFPAYGKYQYFYHECKQHAQLYPLGPPMDIRNDKLLYRYFELINKETIYTCNTDTVLNNQRAHTRALDRRTDVRNLLLRAEKYLDISLTTQWSFWSKFRNCLVSVVVPGACNNMVDRGHLEQLGLGVCTISPTLWTVFPYRQTLQPWIHYIPCKDDYTDLLDKIAWCRENRNRCREIGKNAKEFFLHYYAPQKYWQWVEDILQ